VWCVLLRLSAKTKGCFVQFGFSTRTGYTCGLLLRQLFRNPTIAALDGFVVGPQGGTCGAAVNRREPVFVSDVLTDPILEQVRDVIAAHGIRARCGLIITILGARGFLIRRPVRKRGAASLTQTELNTRRSSIAWEHALERHLDISLGVVGG
jgi:hypothetical protein